MKLNLSTFAILLIFANACSCGDDGFDPLGDDGTFSATWTVDGEPASAVTCAKLGIDQVRIRFFAAEGPLSFTQAALNKPCAGGTTDVIGMNAGMYRFQLEGLGADGSVVRKAPADIDTATIETIEVDGTVERSYNFAGNSGNMGFDVGITFEDGYASDNFSACASGDVANIDYALKDSSNGEVETGTQACSDPAVIMIRSSDGFSDATPYTLEVSGKDGDGNVVWMGSCTVMAEPGVATSDCKINESVQPSIELTLKWEDPNNAASFVDCATLNESGLTFMWKYVEVGSDHMDTPWNTESSCLDMVSGPVNPGTYDLWLVSTGGSKGWGDMEKACQGMAVTRGKVVMSCDLPITE